MASENSGEGAGRRENASAGRVPHPDLPVGIELRRNRMLQALVIVYVAFWGLAAVAPVDRHAWLLENLLVFVAVGLLVLTHGRFVFSNLSYVLIFCFLVLHTVGSHYTYSQVPLGYWVQDALGLGRNHYDRAVHLGFGLLMAYPLRELTLRRVHAHRVWSYVVPVFGAVSMSAGYEIIEWGAARVVDPDLGIAYVGAQGDVWDGQKDMGLALLGAVFAMALAALHRHRTGREAYLGVARIGS